MLEFKGKFSDLYLKALKSEIKKNLPTKEYDLREGHGFGIRVRTSGVITFFYMYHFDGKRKFLNLGIYPDVSLSKARQGHADAFSNIKKNIDPKAPLPELPPEPEVLTISKLKSNYIEHIKTHLASRSVMHQDSRLEKHLIPVWGERNVTGICRRDAILLIEQIAENKPGAARNVLLAARAMFTYAVHREMIEYNPFSGVGLAVPQASPNSRERALSDNEIKHVWHSLITKSGSDIIRRAILFILVTAQRPGEVAGMHINEFSVGEGKALCHTCKRCGWWTIPAHRSKNGRENRVYLTPLAMSLMPSFDEYIYPASRGAEGPVLVNSLSHHVAHNSNPPYLGLSRWTPHDLRRTAATGLASIGCPDEIIDEIQNHKKRGVIRTYNRYKYEHEKREWLMRWTDHLEKLIQVK